MEKTNQKVVVKLATEERGVKRLKAAPSNFAELLGVVRDQTKQPQVDTSVLKISYVDDAGDEVAVSDDEDLYAAYDWASTQPNSNIKLSVTDKKKRRKSDEVKEVTNKFDGMKISQPQDSSSDSSDDEKKPIMHGAIGIGKTGDNKKDKKALRKFIKHSMKKHSKELIKSIIEEQAEPQIQEETKASEKVEDLRQSVHERVECDGCGVSPIVGPRFKCTVLKDFDYCAKCEATKPHAHPFIKINDPKQAPRALFTVVNEEVSGQDKEQQKPWQRGSCFRGGMMRGCRGMRGGRGGASPGENGGHCRPRWGPCGKFGPPADFDQEAFAAQMKEFGQNMSEWGKQFGEQKDGQQQMDPNVMKKKVGWFMRQLFAGKNPTTEGGNPFMGGCGKKEWKKCDDGRKNPHRASIVSQPMVGLVGCPGDTLYAEITFNNGGKHPYRQGFHVSSCFSTEAMKGQFDEIRLALGEIQAESNYTVRVPIKIKQNIMTCVEAGEEYYAVQFGVTNSKDEKVGQQVTVKVKVIETIDEMVLYEKVSMLLAARNTGATAGGSEQTQFDDAVQVLKEAEYDVQKALAILASRED